MNKNKHWLVGVALAGATSMLVACSSGTSSESTAEAAPATSAAAEPENKNLIWVAGVAGDPFYVSVECSAKATADELGYTLDVQAPTKWDVTLQRPIVDAAIAAGPAGLLVTPNDSAALQTSLEQAKNGGMTIVLTDTTTEDPSVAASAVSGDNIAIGTAAFEAIKQAHPEGGKILMINSAPGITTGDLRAKGFEDAVKAAEAEGFTYLGQQFAQDDNAKAAQLTAAALAKDPDIVGIFGTSGNETQGAATAVRQAGMKGKVTIVGVDAYPAQIKDLESGAIQALIAQDVAGIGQKSVQQMVNALTGQPVEAVVTTGVTILTKENLSSAESQAAIYKTSCS